MDRSNSSGGESDIHEKIRRWLWSGKPGVMNDLHFSNSMSLVQKKSSFEVVRQIFHRKIRHWLLEFMRKNNK